MCVKIFYFYSFFFFCHFGFQPSCPVTFDHDAFDRVYGMVFLERRHAGHVRIHLSAMAAVLATHKRQKPTSSGVNLHATAALRRVLRRRRLHHAPPEERESINAC